MQRGALVIDIQLQHFLQCSRSLRLFAQSQAAETDQVFTMNEITPVEVLLEYQHVRQRDGKIVDGDAVEQMRLAECNELIKESFSAFMLPQLAPGQGLVYDLVRLRVVIVDSLHGLADTDRRLLKIELRFLRLAQPFVYT